MPKSAPKLAICDVTISPDVDIRLIITNISQKIGVLSMAPVAVNASSFASPLAAGGGLQAERGEEADHPEDQAELLQRGLVARAGERTRRSEMW